MFNMNQTVQNRFSSHFSSLVPAFVLVMLCLMPAACGNSDTAKTVTEIKILHAGSLSIPFKEIAQAFMQVNPQYNVLLEGHGSRTCARQITDLNRRVDVMASADSEVIRNLLMPAHADFCIDFTTNQMVVMYTEKSKFADSITSDNWYETLLKPEVQYGHSDPNADPCGYRAVLSWQLAEKYYNVDGLFKQLTDKMPKSNIRPKETDLLALLEAGELDYIFIYRSVAEQHHAKFVVLPDEVNLKSPALADVYATASMKISGKQPGELLEVKGAPMVYGITLPKNGENPQGGVKFLTFLLGPQGRAIMEKNGQPELIPPRTDNKDALPEAVKIFFTE